MQISTISRRAMLLGLGALALPSMPALALGSSTITGGATTYTNAQDGTLVIRSNSSTPMVDTLPGIGSGVLTAGVVISIYNDDTLAFLGITVGSGALIDDQHSIVIGPKQSAKIFSDGSNYRSLNKPDYARNRYGNSVTLHIASTGDDNNCGLTTAASFLTLQAAWNFAAFNIHLNSGSVIFQIADSASDYAGVVCNGFHVGYGFGEVKFRGNVTTPANVKVNNTIAGLACFLASNGASIYVEGVTLQSVNNCLETNWAALIFFKTVVFKSAGNVHIQSITDGYIEGNGNYSIEAGAAVHWSAGNGGMVHIGGITITVANTPNFPSGFANASMESRIFSLASFTGSATGVKRLAQMNSVVYNAGSAAFPGDSTATPGSGSQFAGP